LVDDHLGRTGRRFFIVTLNGHPEGIITTNEINNVPRAQWPYKTVSDVMRPFDQAQTVGPNSDVTEALELMASQDLNQLPVIANGALAGLISRGNVLQLIQTRAELHL
jgi:CBS domain-containing protein